MSSLSSPSGLCRHWTYLRPPLSRPAAQVSGPDRRMHGHGGIESCSRLESFDHDSSCKRYLEGVTVHTGRYSRYFKDVTLIFDLEFHFFSAWLCVQASHWFCHQSSIYWSCPAHSLIIGYPSISSLPLDHFTFFPFSSFLSFLHTNPSLSPLSSAETISPSIHTFASSILSPSRKHSHTHLQSLYSVTHPDLKKPLVSSHDFLSIRLISILHHHYLHWSTQHLPRHAPELLPLRISLQIILSYTSVLSAHLLHPFHVFSTSTIYLHLPSVHQLWFPFLPTYDIYYPSSITNNPSSIIIKLVSGLADVAFSISLARFDAYSSPPFTTHSHS